MADLWTRKIKTAFLRLDIDGNGVLTKNDHLQFAERFIGRASLSEQEILNLRDAVNKSWDIFARFSDDKGTITLQNFMGGFSGPNAEEIKVCITDFFGGSFDVIDVNQDGSIQWKEFEEYFKVFVLDSTCAKESFQALDTDKDGVIDKNEFTSAALEFFMSKEDTNTKLFFGPLVE